MAEAAQLSPKEVAVAPPRRCACGGLLTHAEECPACRARRLSQAARSWAEPAPEAVGSGLAGSGSVLSAAVLGAAKARLGHDFSGVRIHADHDADRSARAVGASAFTVGSDIAFAAGRYAPDSVPGRKLLWHELTHVAQQRRSGAPDRGPIQIARLRTAEDQANRAAAGAGPIATPVPLPAASGQRWLQRQTPEDESKIRGVDSDDDKIRAALGLTRKPPTGVTWLGGRPEWFHADADSQVQWLGRDRPSEGLAQAVDAELHKPPAQRARPIPAAKPATKPVPKKTDPGQPHAGPAHTVSVPVTYEAVPAPGQGGGRSPGTLTPGLTTGGALGAHNLAFGELDWLNGQGGAFSSEYLGSLVPRPGMPLTRKLDVLPRDLTPKLDTYQGGAKGWASDAGPLRYRPDPASPATRLWTVDELRSIEGLVRRWNTEPSSLSPAELQLLREAVRQHLDASTLNTPITSYSKPGTEVSWPRKYSVKVNVDKSAALDVTEKNAFTGDNPDLIGIFEEAEVSVVGDQSGRIISVQRVGTPEAWAVRNATPVRWGGRILLVGGLAYSGYKIADAAPEDRPHVAGEEVGGQLGGFGGGLAATTGCIALGIATEGVGLFLCGLGGGIAGGIGGSAAGGSLVDAVQHAPEEAYLRALQQQGDPIPPGAQGAVDDLLGPPVF